MDVLLSLEDHHKPVCSTFLYTASPFLYSVGTDQGRVLLYDVNAAFHSSCTLGGRHGRSSANRHRNFGNADDDSAVPLTSARLQGRVCALEAVSSSPLVVASSCVANATSPTPSIAADFSSSLVQFHSTSVGGVGLVGCSPFGESAPSKLGGGSFGSLFGGPPGGVAHTTVSSTAASGGGGGCRVTPNARYTLQLLDLRVASSQNNSTEVSNGAVVFGGGADNGGSANVGISRAGIFAEHVAVHPSLPFVATCGTMYHGRNGSRRSRGVGATKRQPQRAAR